MTTYPIYDPSDRKPSSASIWLIRLPLLFIIGTILLVLLLGGFIVAVQMLYQDAIMPGVWVNEVNVGGMSQPEAMSALTDSFTYTEEAIFTFRYTDETGLDDRFWQLSAGELGVSFDAEQTVEQAFAAGRSSNILFDVVEQASIWFNGRPISPIVRYDQAIATQKLIEIAETINRPAQNASLNIDGLIVSTTPGIVGMELDIPATLQQVDRYIANVGTGGEIALVIRESHPQIMNVDAAAQKVRDALSGPLTLVAQGLNGEPVGPWHAYPNDLVSLLKVAPTTGEDGYLHYEVDINAEAFRSFLEGLAPSLRTEPKNARFQFNDDTRSLEVMESGVNGRSLNVESTLERIRNSVFSVDANARTVPVVFDHDLPQYHNAMTAAELGITEMVSQGTTYFTGSPANRRENIIISAERFNGTLIAPGETFSFNTLLGKIDPEEGFVSGAIIANGRTIQGVGGGVCQVSTTVYQAAFYAGYPIIERWAHGYRVHYYESGEGVGMDAAIYQSDDPLSNLDFRFLNDTDYHLLIETSVFPGESAVQFRFYSTNPGRQVVKSGPQIRDITEPKPTVYIPNDELGPGQERWVDWAAEGAYVVVTRRILDAQGNEIESREIRSQYQAWGAMVEVSPTDGRVNTPG
jgi:vancomycin resistance protein YoaR